MNQNSEVTTPKSLPGSIWIPEAVSNYLRHTEEGVPIRALARDKGCHASTILRQVRKFEKRRDEFLVDEALKNLGRALSGPVQQECSLMTDDNDNSPIPDHAEIERESRRVMRRLTETGAILAVAKDMEKAVVVRELPDGRTLRTGTVDRAIAQAMVLKDWITCKSDGRISRYRITQAGRKALKRLLEMDPNAHHGFAESQAVFADQHREYGEKHVHEKGESRPRRVRYNVAEAPIASLARRTGKDGKPFLTDELVAAGERLREDFEMAQMGPRVAQNWEKFLTGGDRGTYKGTEIAVGPDSARERVAGALTELGPGLSDVALRCCCFLEGLEVAEKQLGWAARSGKIVLRIALQRLKRYYEGQGSSALIG